VSEILRNVGAMFQVDRLAVEAPKVKVSVQSVKGYRVSVARRKIWYDLPTTCSESSSDVMPDPVFHYGKVIRTQL
jgi:hypothetical protein